ncbi:MAG: T9SS type A sorting domain-containing protein [Bacteroidota bacterium]|nr:T9SS type A sorting domain-containing protein [Bacteroidota bacterium]
MKNLIITTSLILCLQTIITAQTLNKYQGRSGDGYASASANKSSALPVILSSFNLIKNDKLVTLSWSTTSETSSELFMIQRSFDGVYFETINEQAAQGNSFTKINYSYTDSLNDQTGTIYYKLLQKDVNQYAKSVGVKTINFNGAAILLPLTLYPNPANEYITLLNENNNILRDFSVIIVGMDGKIYHNGLYTNSGIDVSNFAEGIYILNSFATPNQTLKFVVKH